MKTINRRQLRNLLYVLPFVAVICIFMVKPVLDVIYGSFFLKKLNGDMIFCGLQNFADVLAKDVFAQVTRNTVVWVVATVVLKNIFGLLLALVMEKQVRGRRGFQLVALLPWATPWMISSILFKWLFDGLYGYLNAALYRMGFIEAPVDWLGNPDFALWAVIIANVWTAIPFCAFVYLSALNSIPRYLYEAAEMDGAGAWVKFRCVTFPQILPTLQLLTVLITIWGINSFDMIYTMTDGGPVNASETLVTLIYRLGFRLNTPGQANALSVVVFCVMMTLVVWYLNMGRSNEENA